MSDLRVFTFSPGWGLPTTGPFALKLMAWLNLAGIAYTQVIEDDPRKGPKSKNPWIVRNGEAMGDSELIIARLAAETGFEIDARLSPLEAAEALAWRRTFEEHFHQVLEWELFCHPAGAAYVHGEITGQMPPVVGGVVSSIFRKHFAKQLHARGIARHTPERIAAAGIADLDALAVRLSAGKGPLLFGDQPTSADIALFGLIAPMAGWPMQTPVARHAKSLAPITAFIDHMRAICGMAAETQKHAA